MFTVIEESYIVLRLGGVFRPAKVFVRKGYLYANHGSGFVMLSKHENGTSVPRMTYEDLTVPFTPVSDHLGRLQKPAA